MSVDPITVIGLAKTLYGILKKPKTNMISYEDALAQAQAAINPSYATNLQRSISALNANAASRGVSGQDRTNNQVAAQVSASEAQRSANVASAAQAIMNGQNAQNLATYQAQNAQSNYNNDNLMNLLASLSKDFTKGETQDYAWGNKGGYQWVQGSGNNSSNSNKGNRQRSG